MTILTTIIDLIFSIFVTWGIGLAPALLVRFLFVKRPIGKIWAIVVSAISWMVNTILLSALLFYGFRADTLVMPISGESDRATLALVAVVSYFILRKGSKKRLPDATENK